MIDERNPAEEQEEREATREGRAEAGPLAGTQKAADTQPAGAGAGGGTARATTAAPPNR